MEQQQAFVLRIAPDGADRVDEALTSNEIFIGWSKAPALLNPELDWNKFREIMRTSHYPQDLNLRRAGVAAGHMWRFLREMKVGDLVVVPRGSEFYLARIDGPPTYDPSKESEGTAFRRKVIWLNDKRPVPRKFAQAALQSRMKVHGTSAYASDLLREIQNCLELEPEDQTQSFDLQLRQKLTEKTLEEIRSGSLDSFGFELLIKNYLERKGAESVRIVARSQDQGADVVAVFRIAGAISVTVAVQAKHYYRPEPPVQKDAVQELIRGIEAESADLGMLITAGTISKEAEQLAEEYFVETGVRIELIDGPQLALLIVETGLPTL